MAKFVTRSSEFVEEQSETSVKYFLKFFFQKSFCAHNRFKYSEIQRTCTIVPNEALKTNQLNLLHILTIAVFVEYLSVEYPNCFSVVVL